MAEHRQILIEARISHETAKKHKTTATKLKEAQKLIERLKKEIQAKAHGQAVYATSFKPSGNKSSWLKDSGIPESAWWAVDFIVTRESGWNPCAYYPGQSNCGLTAAQVNATDPAYNSVACGLLMSKECGKWGKDWTDPVNQLKKANVYVQQYGGWAGAVAFWKIHHSY